MSITGQLVYEYLEELDAENRRLGLDDFDYPVEWYDNEVEDE